MLTIENWVPTHHWLLPQSQFFKWAHTGAKPLIFCLSYFTFPTGFLTAVLQTSARANSISVDTLSWEFIVQVFLHVVLFLVVLQITKLLFLWYPVRSFFPFSIRLFLSRGIYILARCQNSAFSSKWGLKSKQISNSWSLTGQVEACWWLPDFSYRRGTCLNSAKLITEQFVDLWGNYDRLFFSK